MTLLPTTTRGRVKLVGNVLSALLLATVCAAALALLIVPKATGAKPLTVLTGSMRGTYDPGSVVVVRPVKPSQLQVGDTLTYQITSDQPDVITHRIIKISFGQDGKRQFITQGDANGAPDADPVVDGQVRGTVWYSVPWVGYASTALQPSHRELGIKVASGALIAYAAYLFAAGLLEHRRRRRDRGIAEDTGESEDGTLDDLLAAPAATT
jgi:signal peptidase